MSRCDVVRTPTGHLKAAPLLAVSVTTVLPDTLPDTGNTALARVSVKVSGCPAEMPVASRTHTRARTHEHTHIYNGHPDTVSIGAGLGCPVPIFVADTTGHPGCLPDTSMSKDRKPMRDSMPTCAAFIDSMREAFGADQVDPSIRAGMRGEPGKFWAREGGYELGTPDSPADAYVWRKQ